MGRRVKAGEKTFLLNVPAFGPTFIANKKSITSYEPSLVSFLAKETLFLILKSWFGTCEAYTAHGVSWTFALRSCEVPTRATFVRWDKALGEAAAFSKT